MSEDSKQTETSTSGSHVEKHIPFASSLKISPLYGRVSAVLHWRDPIQSALLFAIGNFFFFLITVGEYTILTLFCYLALALIVVCASYAGATLLRAHYKKEPAENPFLVKLRNPLVVSRATLEPHIDAIVGVLNDFLDLSRAVLYITEWSLTAKAAVFIWLVSIVGKLFSGTCLLYMSFLAAFVWPRIYQEKQADIDRLYNLALEKINFYISLALAKLPLGKKKKTE
jgi:hypothetical protein